MTFSIKRLALAAAVASLGIVAATPDAAVACDTTSSTDISCGGANSSPANPLNIANEPHPENNSSNVTAAAPGGRPIVFNPGGSLSQIYSEAGLCKLGDEDCPRPGDDPSVRPAHRRRHAR